MKPETIKESASGAYKVLGEIRHLLTIWACRKRLLTGETYCIVLHVRIYLSICPSPLLCE
jgi:hypothetical protein